MSLSIASNIIMFGWNLEICFSTQAGKWLENPLLKVRSKDSRTTSLIANSEQPACLFQWDLGFTLKNIFYLPWKKWRLLACHNEYWGNERVDRM